MNREILILQQNLVNSFKENNEKKFQEYLYEFIKLRLKREIYLILKIINYCENENDAIIELLVYFIEKKLPEIKLKFSNDINEKHFLATIFLALKNSAQDILMQDNVYNAKQRIRKDIKKYSETSKTYKILKENNKEFVKLIDTSDNITQPEYKKNNLLGISGKDIEKVIKIVLLHENFVELNQTVNLCYNYLKKNGYLNIPFMNSIDKKNKEDDDEETFDIEDKSQLNDIIDTEIYSKITEKIIKEINNTLTEYQKNILTYLLKDNLSLTEIANELDISSQSLNYYKKTLFSLINKITIKHLKKYDLQDEEKFFHFFIEKLKEKFLK